MFAGICRGLEVEVVTREPVGAECKGSCGSCGGIHGTGEGGNTVAPQGHVVHSLTEQDRTVCIERLDGYIHFLLVGGEEQEVEG